jgi:hypothetical protein
MAPKKGSADIFANMAYLAVTESAANTLTFAQLQLASSLMSQKSALIIHRLDIFPDINATILAATNDQVGIALTLTDRITAINDLSQPEILFYRTYKRIDFGVSATGMQISQPEIVDFSPLPGGGILVPADRLYIAICGISAAAAGNASMRLYYTVKELDTTDYWELIEARRIMTT